MLETKDNLATTKLSHRVIPTEFKPAIGKLLLRLLR
jgi:hypothetical protein